MNEEVRYLQILILSLVDAQYHYKQENKLHSKFENQKIYEQMEVLQEWWDGMDSEKQKTVPVLKFRDLMRQKRIITRDSEVYRLIANCIPLKEILDEQIRQSQFSKIFAKAILRDAITNIYQHIKQTTKHELGIDSDAGQLLKVLKFQRDLIIGGLKAQHDVNGVDAVSMVLQLENQKKRYPQDFQIMVKEQVSYDSIIRFLNREKEMAQKAKPAIIAKDQTFKSKDDQQLFAKKQYLDLNLYE